MPLFWRHCFMRLPFTRILLLAVLFSACTVSEKNIAGNYAPQKEGSTQLHIDENKQFDWIFSEKNNKQDTSQRYYAHGNWEKKGRKLILNPVPVTPAILTDSIGRFTNISSFHFRNRFGEAIPIRYIILSGGKPKPHFGNSLFFFAQDFKTTDTVHFHFDGYPAFSYPGSVPYAIGDNAHTITLAEPAYNNSSLPPLLIRKNKLAERKHKQRWYKKRW